ncbi:hypothetical protein GGS23DRAFT_599765 [Durotheca rogersii]|uniref:uncharacterized protein n=1 Tax=Durotheca rogersii TaxID=419775 RepID=UPI00221F59AF|nr:uncharacterized protein GGS23DRAFT_599765 [Durotheca rogersii]KAI5860115.1 hypothetical protein GGS23DRAFT_599765 [Durotheca rogersii]
MALGSQTRRSLVWITALAGLAAGVELGVDIKSLVPACAQPCLTSFVKSNYPPTDCAANPTLSCICSEQSTSGYTIGEGALQCISVEIERGVCDQNLTSSAKRNAYVMCSGIEGALPNTHTTLTATVVSDADGGSGTILASPAGSGSTGILSTTASEGPAPSSAGQDAGSTATNGAGNPEPASAGSLTTIQIVGIVVGVVGVIIITLAAIFIARCIRKRKYPDPERAFVPIDDERSKSRTEAKKPGTPRISPPFRRYSNLTEPQLPPRLLTASPNVRAPTLSSRTGTPNPRPLTLMENPRTPPPNPGASLHAHLSPRPSHEIIGAPTARSLTATPSAAPEPVVQRPVSRLLPAKPTLGLTVPPPRPPPPVQPLLLQPVAAEAGAPTAQTPLTDRASVLTNMTAFADMDTEAPDGNPMWRRQPPNDASALYVADKWGNWVLNNGNRKSELAQVAGTAELDAHTSMTKSPIEREEEAEAMEAGTSATKEEPQKPPPAFLSQDPSTTWKLYRSSSVYSQASTIWRNSRNVMRSRSQKSEKGAVAQIDTNASRDSVTTISTSMSSPFDMEVPFEFDDVTIPRLPPLAETTSPTTGRSPVTYPEIPGRINRVLPEANEPPKPDFMMTLPPGQPSPTLGETVGEATSPYPRPLNTKRSMKSKTPLASPDIDLDLPQPPRLGGNLTPIPSPVSRFSPRVPHAETFGPDTKAPERLHTPPVQTPAGLPSSPLSAKTTASRPSTANSQPHVARAISPMTFAMMSSTSLAASSLLAKRIGNDKAVALALAPDSKKQEQPWRRNGSDPKGLLSPEDAGLSSPKGTLPHTPTWQPKLTPTRRGDDLYLDVR